MKYFRNHGMPIALLLIMLLCSVYLYQVLPDQVPMSFDINGHPSRYSSKEFFSLFWPGMYLFCFILIKGLVRGSPRDFAVPQSKSAIDRILLAIGILFMGIQLGVGLNPDNPETAMRFVGLAMGLFLIIGGNIMGKTERNFVIGIRIPWTIASEANWRATHRVAGKLMVIAGFCLLITSFLIDPMFAIIIAVWMPLMIAVGYSYHYFRTREST